MNVVHILLALAAVVALTSCAAKEQTIGLSEGEFLSVDPHPERSANDELRQDIGRQFIVEHFEAATEGSVLQGIAQHRPAGFVFWNANRASGTQLREVIKAYATKAATTGDHKGLLFSTDYEGGGLAYTINSNPLVGIQRFRKGMTGLVHPSWLERSMPKFGVELCKLHGEIMATELTSIGINYPLTMVSDLSNELFAMRSVSKDPETVSACLQAAMDAFIENGHIVFVTKHFPGLGQTRGDTHAGTVVSRVTDMGTEQQHMQPFIDLIKESKVRSNEKLLSILASHAKIPLLDADHITTESPKILQGVLRQQLGFNGLVVSDAMWMGEYEPKTMAQMLPVYLTSFVSGMDILMIKGTHFGGAVEFFRQVYDNEVPAALQLQCEQRMGLQWPQIRQMFLLRMKETSQRLDAAISQIGDPRDQMKNESPRDETTIQRARYDEILLAIDPRWRSVLPKLRAQEEPVRQTLARH